MRALVRPRRPPDQPHRIHWGFVASQPHPQFLCRGQTSDTTEPEGHPVLGEMAKIKSNMKATNRRRRRTARSAPWGSPLPLVKTKSGGPGSTVDRVEVVPQQRVDFAAAPSHSRGYDELKKPDNPRGCRLRVGSWNVGSMSCRDGELAEMAHRRGLDFCCFQETKWKGEANKWLGEEGKR